jgi:hypothetical protein
MNRTDTGRPWVARSLVLSAALVAVTPAVPILAASTPKPICSQVGGTLMTNLGVISPDITLGTVTGDLKGAVSATILEITPHPDGAISFNVQHHWVVEAGDTIFFDPVEVLAVPVAPGVYGATVQQTLKIARKGGTGRFQGATGALAAFGAAVLFADGGGETVFRYSGQVCVVPPSVAGNREE